MNTLPALICTVNDVDLTTGKATVKDTAGKKRTVRMDIRKGGGPYPRVGEMWIIAQHGGEWSFDSLVRGNPPVMAGNTQGIGALNEVLYALDQMGFIENLTSSIPPVVPTPQGYRHGTPLYFTTSNTFVKASYPGAVAFQVECQGAGGGGGNAQATGAGEASRGGGGGGGCYARSLLLASALAATESIVVGAGGIGGDGSPPEGAAGGASSFGSLVSAPGGGGGDSTVGGTTEQMAAAGAGGGVLSGGVGDLLVRGDGGGAGFNILVTGRGVGGYGGGSFLGGSTRDATHTSTTGGTGQLGLNGTLYGGAGSGAFNAQSSAQRSGGDGAPGIVIVTPMYV